MRFLCPVPHLQILSIPPTKSLHTCSQYFCGHIKFRVDAVWLGQTWLLTPADTWATRWSPHNRHRAQHSLKPRVGGGMLGLVLTSPCIVNARGCLGHHRFPGSVLFFFYIWGTVGCFDSSWSSKTLRLPLLWSHCDDMVLQGRATDRKTRAAQCKLPPCRENARELCFPEGPPFLKEWLLGILSTIFQQYMQLRWWAHVSYWIMCTYTLNKCK